VILVFKWRCVRWRDMGRNFRDWKRRCLQSRGNALVFSTRNYRAEMPLDELREAREMTQVHLAKILGVNQAAVVETGTARGYVREHAAEFLLRRW